MENMYFSPTTVGFMFLNKSDLMMRLKSRQRWRHFEGVFIWGADTFNVERDAATVTYPTELLEYVTTYNAPVKYPGIDRPYGFCCINAHQQDPVFFHSDNAAVSSAVAISASKASCLRAISFISHRTQYRSFLFSLNNLLFSGEWRDINPRRITILSAPSVLPCGATPVNCHCFIININAIFRP